MQNNITVRASLLHLDAAIKERESQGYATVGEPYQSAGEWCWEMMLDEKEVANAK